jgi:hypothetical protein
MSDDELREALRDPAVVHLNMLRGGIAKPSVAQIWHLYGAALLEGMPAEHRGAALRQVEQRAYRDAVWGLERRAAEYRQSIVGLTVNQAMFQSKMAAELDAEAALIRARSPLIRESTKGGAIHG